MHQNLVDRQAVQPRRERRFAAEASDFAEELDEDFLGEVFRFRRVRGHAQAQGIDAAVVAFVKLLKRRHVSPGACLRKSVIGGSRSGLFGIGCGHL